MKKIFDRAKFPTIMAGISVILFLGIIFIVTMEMVEPYYPIILLFLVPVLCFTALSILRVKEKIAHKTAAKITGVVIGVWILNSILSVPFMLLKIVTTPPTTNPNKYEKLLKVSGYPEYDLNTFFPEEIPENATAIVLDSSLAFLQGGEVYALKYKTDLAVIHSYIERYEKQAKWTGTQEAAEGKDIGIDFQDFSWAGYDYMLPNDFNIYLLRNIKSEENDWNHGQIGYVAISESRKEVIFYAEHW